ncbi:tellurite resistance/C4-dicarboxylate transporter family protein [Halomonas sp. SSL-5]|uniref:tellurite resistance/C4-dicarboxylate transporter family protein n=1 Tax=Halomonas sp. SSL-5 TaxID=3065855 RepID=UPI0027389DD9|nr:tellurite resistance/C4-dicarboxylate transporter family protein [Halomonas sp. SSL-5]MDY7116350.1 tellurite resistance/C4-dicarboxylate transporter family protein [Halomonas sp. SSL-5]
MPALLRRSAMLLDRAAAGLFPGYFAITMATGATSIACHLLGMRLLSLALLAANLLAYTALWGLTIIRLVRYPRRLADDMIDHARGPGFFTIVAGTCILGTQFHLVAGEDRIAAEFWWVGLTLWGLIMYLFFIAVTTREEKPNLASGINGAWLLAAVSTHSVSILTALLPWSGPSDLRLFFALCMFLIGCMLYLAIITLIFYRLTFLEVTVKSLTPPYWINMGAVAIATLAGSTLILRAGEGGVIADFKPFLLGFTVFFWATASWWFPLLVGLMLWRHLIRRHRLVYEPQLWSMVFPLAMYTTGTLRLSAALEAPFLMPIPELMIWLVLLAWSATSAAMFHHFWRLARSPRS